MGNLNSVLETFFYGFCSMAKWLFAIRMASDIIKKGNDSDIQGIIHSVINGSVGYASLYCVVGILNQIQSSMSK